MTHKEKKPATDREAIKSLSSYTSVYLNIAFCQYKLSRQKGRSIEESLQDTYNKILGLTNEVIGDSEQ